MLIFIDYYVIGVGVPCWFECARFISTAVIVLDKAGGTLRVLLIDTDALGHSMLLCNKLNERVINMHYQPKILRVYVQLYDITRVYLSIKHGRQTTTKPYA